MRGSWPDVFCMCCKRGRKLIHIVRESGQMLQADVGKPALDNAVDKSVDVRVAGGGESPPNGISSATIVSRLCGGIPD